MIGPSSRRPPAAVAAVLLLLACARSETPPAPARPPDIVFVTADALRPDHLSLNGYPRQTSPAIDAFARRAWHFPEAVSVIPKTGPSFATMFSGVHPSEHGLRDNLGLVPAGLPWAAEILRGRGYTTAAFVSNPALHRRWGYDRGFDVYRLLGDVGAVNREFVSWAEHAPEGPSFVWIHYIDPHGPYTPPPELSAAFAGDALDRSEARAALDYQPLPGFSPSKILGAIPRYQQQDGEDRVAHYVRRYDAEIRLVDRAFAEVIDFLERRGRFDASAIFFLSDHGESLGEHDYYFEHGWFAYDASLRVPLLLKPPGAPGPRRVEAQVSTLDVFPTLLELAGVENRWPGPGRSLLAPPAPERDVLVENSTRYPERYAGLRARGLKYLRNLETGEEELYGLASDPAETRDRSRTDPQALRLARERFERLRRGGTSAAEAVRAPPVEPEHAEALRRLGYVE